MTSEIEFEFPKPGEIRQKEAKNLLRVAAASSVAAFIGSRKPDEIQEALSPERPSIIKRTIRNLNERAQNGRLVVAMTQIGNQRLPVGFASSLPVFETPSRQYVRRLFDTNPIIRGVVNLTPVIGSMLLQKPTLELDPVQVDPELQDDDWLLMELGMHALGSYDKHQHQVGYVPYMEVHDGDETHFVPEETLQPRVMNMLGFEINPLAHPHIDTTIFGNSAEPLVLQPYEPHAGRV